MKIFIQANKYQYLAAKVAKYSFLKFDFKEVDILHIDGSHHYEDVKKDFETWSQFVNDDGVILMHDTCVENFEGMEYGVKKLFNGYLLLLLKIKKDNVIKIAHIVYRENGITLDYYNNNYNNLYILPQSDDIIGYSKPQINTFGYTNIFIYKKDSSRDILQFGIDGEGGVCKLRGINNF
jgi:hypothetical protein